MIYDEQSNNSYEYEPVVTSNIPEEQPSRKKKNVPKYKEKYELTKRNYRVACGLAVIGWVLFIVTLLITAK